MASTYNFTGVTRASHLAALRRFYAVINPEKVGQVELMLEKFGLAIWDSLKAKYPTLGVGDYVPKPLIEASFVGVTEAEHLAALQRFYTDVNPEKLATAGPALAKFKANVWAAIAEKYPNVDINAYAPIRKASAPLQSAPRPIVTPTYTPQTFAPAPQPVPQPQQQVPVVKPVSTGNPFTTHTPVTTQESTNPFQRYQAPSPAPAPAPRNPFASTPPLSRSGSMKLTASDLEPTAFTGVPDSAHIDGLRTFYSAVAPEKVGQVMQVWQKFGPGVWKALLEKYPDVDFGKFAPVRNKPSFASTNAFALTQLDSPRSSSTDNIFGNDSPILRKNSPFASSGASNTKPDTTLLPTTSTESKNLSVTSLFGDSTSTTTTVPKSSADLFKNEFVGGGSSGTGTGSRMFSAGGGDDKDETNTPSNDGEQGSFAAALLEADGGVRDVMTPGSMGGLFNTTPDNNVHNPSHKVNAPSFGEISSMLEQTSKYASSDYNSLFMEPSSSKGSTPIVPSSSNPTPKPVATTDTLFTPSTAVDEAGGFFSEVKISDDSASTDLFGMVSSNKQAGNNKPTTPGIGDIASYVKSSQTGSSTETSTLFQ